MQLREIGVSMRIMTATDFRAHRYAVLRDVAKTGISVIVTKRGRPVGRVSPLDGEEKID